MSLVSVFRRRPGVAALAFAAFTGATFTSADACPVCDTGTGRQVRAGILDADFAWNLAAIGLPFLVVGTVILGIHAGWFERGRP